MRISWNPRQQKYAQEQGKHAKHNQMSGYEILASKWGFSRKLLFSVDLN